jgi:hypothetical protein
MARVRYGKFVIEFETDAELDAFLARHGGEETNEESQRPRAADQAPPPNRQAGREIVEADDERKN